MSTKRRDAMDRRAFLRTAFAAAAGAAVLGRARPAEAGAGKAARAPRAGRARAVDDATARFMGEIRPGATMGPCRVRAVHGLLLGGIAVVLETRSGARFQVDVLRRDPKAPGVRDARQVSVFVVNHGDGRQATPEEQGLAAMALADALRDREDAGAEPPAGLLTLAERNRRHAGGVFGVRM